MNDDFDERLIIRLPDKERKRAQRITLLSPILYGLFTVLVIALGLREGLSRGDVHYFVLLVSFFLSGVVYLTIRSVRARTLGWYEAVFEVNRIGIERAGGNDKEVAGRWDQLTYVSPRKRLLYFSDGVVIPLRYGVDTYAKLSKDDLNDIGTMASEGSVYVRAMREYDAAAPSRASGYALMVVAFTSIGVAGYLLAENVVSESYEILIATIPLAAVLISYFLVTRPRLAIERKYGPPRGEM